MSETTKAPNAIITSNVSFTDIKLASLSRVTVVKQWLNCTTSRN